MSNSLPPLANGRYTLATTLGKGGMATVYGGFDTMLEVERAVKVLSPKLCSNEKVQKRFMAEARAMAKLRHPNIVTIFDVGIDGETPYIVMEKIDGGAVIDWLDKNGPQGPEVAGNILLGVLAGLQASHDRGIVHRDIKPHNMLLSSEGMVKITDYGIANIEEDERSFTKTGAIMGTLAYMPPEQRVSAKGLGATADVFAAGASLFALLTHKEPFDLYNESLFDSLYEGIPSPFRTVITTACQYDPAKRYQSATAMSVALQQAMGELGVSVAQNFQISMDGSAREDGTRLFDGAEPPEPALPAPENTTINPHETWLGQQGLHPPGLTGVELDDDDYVPPRKPRTFAIGAAVVVALVGAFVVFQPDQASPENATQPVSVPDAAPPAVEQAPTPAVEAPEMPDPEPEIEAASVPAAASPPAAPTPSPEKRAEKPKKPDPPAKVERTAERTPDPAPPPEVVPARIPAPTPKAAPAPADGPGRLSVRVIPPSAIEIDGKKVGIGMVRGHSLSPGPHRVVLTAKDGRVKSTTVNIASGKPSVLCWSFEINDICPR